MLAHNGQCNMSRIEKILMLRLYVFDKFKRTTVNLQNIALFGTSCNHVIFDYTLRCYCLGLSSGTFGGIIVVSGVLVVRTY